VTSFISSNVTFYDVLCVVGCGRTSRNEQHSRLRNWKPAVTPVDFLSASNKVPSQLISGRVPTTPYGARLSLMPLRLVTSYAFSQGAGLKFSHKISEHNALFRSVDNEIAEFRYLVYVN
jgi:hypothetical protein